MTDSHDYHHLGLRKRVGLEIARLMHNNIAKEHPLQQLFWESTLRCNLHCRHCGSDCRREAGREDMPVEDFLRVLDSVSRHYDPHKVFVIISGGEPLMRDDLEQCGRMIYERGFPWGMVTNGLYLTPERFRGLMDAGLHSMTVSLDGLEQSHNWMRGHKDSFARASAAIDLMVAEPRLVFDVVTCVNRHNYHELADLREFLIKKGVRQWRVITVFPVGRAATDNDMRLSASQFRGVMDFIRETRADGRIMASYGCEGFLGKLEHDVRDYFYHCEAGITVGSVLIDGSISACTSIRSNYHQGNIYKDDFIDVWENRFEPYRNHEWMRQGECADCKLFRYCQGNGMHLRDDNGQLLLCNLHRLEDKE
ncbi:MAG: TIGR04133 family radical SAM/SPASM protein [Prevotella sp.]|nr:TIGR04133 family radical SAM/SPASM protein [Prevotella sp.]